MRIDLLPIAVLIAAVCLLWPGRRDIWRPAVTCERGSRPASRWDPSEEALEVLDGLCTMLRAGASTASAVRLATEPLCGGANASAGQWQRLEAEVQRDGDVASVWDDLADQWCTPALHDVASVWRLSARHGCPLADAMEMAAANVRARREHSATVVTAVAGSRATVMVLLGLPILGLALGGLLGVNIPEIYTGRAGLITLWPGVALLLLGNAWVRRQTRRAIAPPQQEAS